MMKPIIINPLNLFQNVCLMNNTSTNLSRRLWGCLSVVFFLFVLSSNAALAQTTVAEQHTIVMNSQLNAFFTALRASVSTQPSHGSLSVSNTNNNACNLQYVPNRNFSGLDSFTVDVLQAASPANLNTKRAYVVKVIPGSLSINDDYGFMIAGQGSAVLNVLQNDSSSTPGGLLLKGVSPLTNGGDMSIQDNSAVFSPKTDFIGVAHFSYIACDQSNLCSPGQAHIYVSPSILPATDTTSLGVNKGQQARFMLPQGFSINTPPVHGTVAVVQDGVYDYMPAPYYVGSDQIIFVQNGAQHIVNIDVWSPPTANRYIVNDYAYTTINSPARFNVLLNDASSLILNSVTNSNEGVVQGLADGTIIFTPNTDFEGVATFYYTVTQNNGTAVDEKGQVSVLVSNCNPDADVFQLTTNAGTPLVITYSAPITNYKFHLRSPAMNGSVDTLSNDLTYTPNPGATSDDFFIDYCVGGDCKQIEVRVNIVSPNVPQNLLCSGSDCLWAGDANNDGKVTIDDYIPIAKNIGSIGAGREGGSTEWFAQNYRNWDNYGLQYADTNGDGIIGADDTIAVSKNYNATHTLISEPVTFTDNLPFYVVASEDVVQPGDTLNLALMMGNQEHPALNFGGFTFSLSYENYKVQGKHTIGLDLENNSWLAPRSAYVIGSKRIGHGTIDAGIILSNQRAASGKGQVGKVSIVVADEVAGFQQGVGNTVKLHFTNVHAIKPSGEAVRLKDFDFEVPIVKKNKPNRNVAEKINMYPNPATKGDVQIELSNPTGVITGARLFDATGRLLRQVNNLEAGAIALHTGDLNSGLYLVEVTTSNGRTVKKLEIIKE